MARAVLIETLGCRLNQADSALLTDRLRRAGFTVPEEHSGVRPDAVIVNSCTVTAAAAAKSRQAARRLHRLYPEALIVLTGCSAELDYGKARTTEEGFVILTNPEKRDLGEWLPSLLERRPPAAPKAFSEEAGRAAFRENAFGVFPFRTRAFLKIQEGCDNFCTYCIVPRSRGRERSRAFAEVVADCRQAVAAGFPEIVLTGVNTCAYCDEGRTLTDLVSTLCETIPGEWRLRLSSTEPAPGNTALLETMARYPDRVCRFLHLALQHGADRILRAMHRRYTATQYADFAAEARRLMPDIHLGTDVIVGFPGETEEDFEESFRFIESVNFANLHIFSYSRRAGTPAALMPGQVPENVKKLRHRKLEELDKRMAEAFRQSQRGKSLPVIFETVDANGFAHGWSDNYLAVARPAEEVPLRRIVSVELA